MLIVHSTAIRDHREVTLLLERRQRKLNHTVMFIIKLKPDFLVRCQLANIAEIMAENKIKLIDFRDQSDQNQVDIDRLTFDYNETETIFNLKQKLADREGYDDPNKLKLFLHCLELEDECLIKDCSDEARDVLS